MHKLEIPNSYQRWRPCRVEEDEERELWYDVIPNLSFSFFYVVSFDSMLSLLWLDALCGGYRQLKKWGWRLFAWRRRWCWWSNSVEGCTRRGEVEVDRGGDEGCDGEWGVAVVMEEKVCYSCYRWWKYKRVEEEIAEKSWPAIFTVNQGIYKSFEVCVLIAFAAFQIAFRLCSGFRSSLSF